MLRKFLTLVSLVAMKSKIFDKNQVKLILALNMKSDDQTPKTNLATNV